MNKKMGLMMTMGLLISAPLLSKDYLISTPRTSLLKSEYSSLALELQAVD